MKDFQMGIIASFAVHLCIVLLLFAIPSGTDSNGSKFIPVRLAVSGLDPGNTTGITDSKGRKEAGGKRIIRAGKETGEYRKKLNSDNEGNTAGPSKGEAVAPVDPHDRQALIHDRETRSGEARASLENLPAGFGQDHLVAEIGGGVKSRPRSGSAQGEGGSFDGMVREGKEFGSIREAIIRNVRYPEYARRMGLEGTVLLSFVVLEDGSTSEIKIVKTSGFELLDREAARVIARTRIAKRVPYKRVVLLPVVYSLKQSTGIQ